MKALIVLVLLSLSAVCHAAWISEVSEDPITNHKVGYAAQSMPDRAFSVGCPKGYGLTVVFYWTDDISTDVELNIRLDDGDVLSPLSTHHDKDNATGLGLPSDNVNLIRAMHNAKYLYVRVLLADGTMSRTVTYELAGFAEQFQTVCAWHPGYEALGSLQETEQIVR